LPSSERSVQRGRRRGPGSPGSSASPEQLNTLIVLPLAEVTLLQQVDALSGGAAVYRRIARLREAGLVAELRPLIQPGREPGAAPCSDRPKPRQSLGYKYVLLRWQDDALSGL
jgi:hypothetical protein